MTLPFNLKLYACITLMVLAAYASWKLRDIVADAQIASLQAEVTRQANESLKSLLASSEAARSLEAAESRRTAAVEALAAAQAATQRAHERTITREVIRYVERPDRTAVVLPADWVRIHNLAATPDLPTTATTASELDGASGPASDAEALGVVTDNYGICSATRNQLIALQAWVSGSLTARTIP